MLTTKTNALIDTLISQMATALIERQVDLHDERQVLRALLAAGFGQGDILGLWDQVIASANAKLGVAA